MAIASIPDVVCTGCNGGWMSRIEERCKPLLIALYEGHRGTLNQSEQERLATWAILKHFVWHAHRRQAHATTITARHYLRDHQKPPLGATVTYATYGPGNRLLVHGSHIRNPAGPVEATGLVLGFGMLRVIYDPSAVYGPLKTMGEANDLMADLFPVCPGAVDIPRVKHYERKTRINFLGPEG